MNMSVTINDDTMTSDQNDTVATLVDPVAGLWTVTGRHGVHTRNQAITAMTIAELQARRDRSPHDEFRIAGFERELLVPPMPRNPWALLQTLKAAASAVRSLPDADEFAAPPFGGDIAECLLRIGDAVVDLGATVDKLSDLAHKAAGDTDSPEWRGAVNRADEAQNRLRGAANHLHAAGRDAQAAQVEDARASK
jgi:hypothetical protein